MAEPYSKYSYVKPNKTILVISKTESETFYDICEMFQTNETVIEYYPYAVCFYYLDELLSDNKKYNSYKIFLDSKEN